MQKHLTGGNGNKRCIDPCAEIMFLMVAIFKNKIKLKVGVQDRLHRRISGESLPRFWTLMRLITLGLNNGPVPALHSGPRDPEPDQDPDSASTLKTWLCHNRERKRTQTPTTFHRNFNPLNLYTATGSTTHKLNGTIHVFKYTGKVQVIGHRWKQSGTGQPITGTGSAGETTDGDFKIKQETQDTKTPDPEGRFVSITQTKKVSIGGFDSKPTNRNSSLIQQHKPRPLRPNSTIFVLRAKVIFLDVFLEQMFLIWEQRFMICRNKF